VEDSAVTALVEEQSEVIPNVFTAPSLGLNNNWFPKQKSTIQTESTTDDFAKDTTCPFVIDQLEKTSPETTFRRIAQMCIEVFFNANDDEEYSENRDIPYVFCAILFDYSIVLPPGKIKARNRFLFKMLTLIWFGLLLGCWQTVEETAAFVLAKYSVFSK
jgi:hypothetical protein